MPRSTVAQLEAGRALLVADAEVARIRRRPRRKSAGQRRSRHLQARNFGLARPRAGRGAGRSGAGLVSADRPARSQVPASAAAAVRASTAAPVAVAMSDAVPLMSTFTLVTTW